MNNFSYSPSYIFSSNILMSNSNSNKNIKTSDNIPIKLMEPNLNNFNLIYNMNKSIMSNNSRFHQFEMKENDDSYIMSSRNFNESNNKDKYKKEFKKIFNRNLTNLNSNNTNYFTSDDSKSFNIHSNFIEDNNSINISIFEKKKDKQRIKSTRNINGLNYQDLVNIINKRKSIVEKIKTDNKKVINQLNQNVIEKNDDGVQTSIIYNYEEEEVPQVYPFKNLQRNKSENNAISSNNQNYEENIFSNLRSMNISLNNKNNTFSNRKKEKDLNVIYNIKNMNVIDNNNNIKDKMNKNKINNKNNLINSLEFDLVNFENDSKINFNKEPDINLQRNNEEKKNENNNNINDTDFNIENNIDMQKEIIIQNQNPSFISINTKEDFKIETNLNSFKNIEDQEKSSIMESMINQQSKSLISSTQKNEITELEEYDQDKYKIQNETKEINLSLYNFNKEKEENENNEDNNNNIIKNENKNIKEDKNIEEKKINYFEETIEKFPKKEIKDKVNDNLLNLNFNEFNNKCQLSKRSNSSNLIIKKTQFQNKRYEDYNFQPKNLSKNNNKNNNNKIKINNTALSNKIISKIPVPMKKNELFFKINKSDFKISDRENKKIGSCVTLDNVFKNCNNNNNNNSYKIKNKTKKQRRIDNYSEYYKKKVEKNTKDDIKYLKNNNSHEESYFNKPYIRNSNENSKMNSNKSSKQNKIYLNSAIDYISNNKNHLLNKQNKSTYY